MDTRAKYDNRTLSSKILSKDTDGGGDARVLLLGMLATDIDYRSGGCEVKELVDLLRPSRDLPSLNHVTFFVAE